MEVAILSDDQAAAASLRYALAECDVDCPVDRVWPIRVSASLVNDSSGSLDAVFFMLEESEESLSLLEELCAQRLTATIAVGTARDPRFMMRVIHAGPSDYVDIDGDLAADLRRAIGRLRESITSDDGSGRLISVFSHCGGSGCSLLAANLAVALADGHRECLLCDFNLRRGDLATLLNLKPQNSVNDVCRHGPDPRLDVFEQALTAHESGVQLLAAPASFSDVRPISPSTISQIISHARKAFPYTVADLEDFFHPEQSEVLKQSDSVLFVMRLDYTALRNARRTFEYLEQEGIDGGRFRFIVNQYGRPKELTPGQAEEVLGRAIDALIPFDPKVAIASVNRGTPLVQLAPRSRVARALTTLAEDVTAVTSPVAS